MKNNINLLFVFMIQLLLFSACVQHKELINFPQEKASFTSPEQLINAVELRVQPDDLLRITVSSFNIEAAVPFNIEDPRQQNVQMMQQLGGMSSTNVLELFNGYFVDREGFINFPVLGPLKVEGLSLREVEKLITEGIKPYLRDGVVNARFLNFKITVLGEVVRPGTLRLSNQRINILEAIGMSGDFTPYANRSNVLLIREQDDKREYIRLNFQDESLFSSQYFYLQQNDVIYIEPIRAKIATVQDPFARGVTYGSAIISVVTLIIALLR